MQTEWKPEEYRVRVCLLFDEMNFPVGNPSTAFMESAATLNTGRRGIDLSKCVVDAVEVLSTEISVGEKDRPLFFFLRLKSVDKELTPTILCNDGHPVGEGCGAKKYFERIKRESEERLAKDFGAFLPYDDDMLNALGNDKTMSKNFFTKISHLIPKKQVSHTEKGYRQFHAQEQNEEMREWDKNIREKVESLFHNMTSVSATLTAAGNENAEFTEETSPLLARVVLEIHLRATKKDEN